MEEYRFAEDIEIVQELLNLSTTELAAEIGVSRASLHNWLSGRTSAGEAAAKAFYDFVFHKGLRLNMIKEQLYREELSEKNCKLLFHGAKYGIDGEISPTKSRMNNDFGQGFYCGETLEQSAMFVSSFENASLYMLAFRSDNLQSKIFHVDRDWMLTIAYYRGKLNGFENSPILSRLICQVEKADYLIAPIADNRMFEIIDSFIEGEITDVQCKHCLSATNLGNQYVFLSDKSAEQLEILEKCFLSRGEKAYYLSSRKNSVEINMDKVKLARKQYRGQGKYIEEILI